MKRKAKTMGSDLSLTQLGKLKGQNRFVYHHDLDCLFPVTVLDIAMAGCALKARVVPVGGIGEVEICVGDLLTEDEANVAIQQKVAREQFDQHYREVTRHHYLTQRRAAFILMAEKVCEPDELALLRGEAPEGNFQKAGDGFMRKHTERLLKRKYELSTGTNYEDNDY